MTISNWNDAITQYLTHLSAGGQPDTTLATRKWHLVLAARFLNVDPWAVTGVELVEWFASRVWAQETRRSARSTMRGFYQWSVDSGHTLHSPALALPAVKASTPHPRPIPDSMYRAALLAADERVRFMFRLSAEAGLRRAEVAVVNSNDLVEDLLGWSLLVHGKGRKLRTIPLSNSLAADLMALPTGWVFPGNEEGHLSPRWVGTLVGRCLPEGWTMHKLRHRFASKAYAVDRDVFTVQDLLGHASPVTTRAYVVISDDAKRRTIDAIAA